MKTDIATLAYIAGAVDADGCISMSIGDDARISVSFSIAQVHPEWLKQIQSDLDAGCLAPVRKWDRGDYGRRMYTLSFRYDEMRRILPYLIPFLRQKKVQAKCVLWHFELRNRMPRGDETARDIRMMLRINATVCRAKNSPEGTKHSPFNEDKESA